jgi:hypothetical protein
MAETKMRYYRTNIAGLKVVVGSPEGNDVAPQTVDFVQYSEMWQGDPVRVGYLATDNPVAQKHLKADNNVDEINEEAYTNATDVEVNPKVKRLAV